MGGENGMKILCLISFLWIGMALSGSENTGNSSKGENDGKSGEGFIEKYKSVKTKIKLRPQHTQQSFLNPSKSISKYYGYQTGFTTPFVYHDDSVPMYSESIRKNRKYKENSNGHSINWIPMATDSLYDDENSGILSPAEYYEKPATTDDGVKTVSYLTSNDGLQNLPISTGGIPPSYYGNYGWSGGKAGRFVGGGGTGTSIMTALGLIGLFGLLQNLLTSIARAQMGNSQNNGRKRRDTNDEYQIKITDFVLPFQFPVKKNH